jgi:uncharacterized protein
VSLAEEALRISELLLVQLERIGPYWLGGLLAGSLASVFLADRIAGATARLGGGTGATRPSLPRCLPPCAAAALLGAASPLCMYGTIPLIAALGRGGMPQHVLASFMVASILINPNLLAFSFALGAGMALLRLASCLLAALVAGMAVRLFFPERGLFDYGRFDEPRRRAGSPGPRALASSLGRGLVRTGPYFLGGILATALFDRYFPRNWAASAFESAPGIGPLVAASVGVPFYLCGGGTVPLLKAWLGMGMSTGSAVAFCLSGPATKMTNLGAVKILLGKRNFLVYLAYSILFPVALGTALDALAGAIR